MDPYGEYTQWAVDQGVKLSGIAAHRFPSKGLGIIAKQALNVCRTDVTMFSFIPAMPFVVFANSPSTSCFSHTTRLLTVNQAGDVILTIPNSALRTVYTVPRSISKPIGTITVQGLLAAELAMDTSEIRSTWRAVLPTKKDIEESIPLMWHPSLQALLPAGSSMLVEKQNAKISLDWATVSAAFPALSYTSYLYHWFIVSTRTFYYTPPRMKRRRPVNHDDCLALIPFADLFNHSEAGVEVTYTPAGYKFRTDRQIEKGEEIYISYGNHSNDFLLAEYGFVLDENKWDEIPIDEAISPLFSEKLKQTLKEAGFWGKFVLDTKTVCYRTQVALRILCMPLNRWRFSVATGFKDEDEYQVAVNQYLLKALEAYLDVAHERLGQLKALDCGISSQREMLKKRWKQICLLLTTAIGRAKG